MSYVFNADLMPSRRVQLRQVVTSTSNYGEQLFKNRRDILDRLVTACEDMNGVVKTKMEGHTTEVFVDCFILTTDELYQLVKDKYSEGVNHGMSNMMAPPTHLTSVKQQLIAAIATFPFARPDMSVQEYRESLISHLHGLRLI